MGNFKQEQGRYSRNFGKIAEDIAVEYCVSEGLPILERNWSPKGGHTEIDIISQQDNTIIFIEVKARSGNDNSPLDALTPKKLNNIFRCADAYLRTLKGDYWEYRFDIIAIVGDEKQHTVHHIKDAFLGPLRCY